MSIQSKCRCEGFSLLEIMIVVFLIALLATITSYKIGNGNASAMESEARQLIDKLSLIMDESILTGSSHQLVIEKQSNRYGYYFRKWESKSWQNIEEQPYKLKLLKNGLALDMELFEGSLEDEKNALTINVDGTFSPFTVKVLEYNETTKQVIDDVAHWLISGNNSNNTLTIEHVFDE